MIRRIQASALGMTIVIALVLAVIVGFFVVRQHLYQLKVLRLEAKQRLITNSRSGIEILLSNDSVINYDEHLSLNLFHEGIDSVSLYKTPWGLFELISAVAFSHEGSFETSALVGAWTDPSRRPALYCAEHGRAVVVGGKSVIKGDAFLPEMGIKTGVFEGQFFQGEQVVYGSKLMSKEALPELHEPLIDSLLRYAKRGFGANDSIHEIDYLKVDTIFNSFSAPTLVLFSKEEVHVSDCVLKGRIVIVSEKSVWIDGKSALDGVLIFAPQIEVAPGFVGNAQLFATSRLVIGRDVTLEYPSVVAVLVPNTDQDKRSTEIVVEENVHIEGLLALIDKESLHADHDIIRIEPGFELLGELYCNGRLQIEGKVYGSVWVDRFYRQTASGTFENHLLNTEICSLCCPEEYLSAILWVNKRRKIVKWIS